MCFSGILISTGFSAEPVQQLVLELTERDALLDVDYRLRRELHCKGVKLAIDDFGTGNSSLSWLEKLRPDILKIDKSFTAAIGTDAVNSTVTDIIIALGQKLNMNWLRKASKARNRHNICASMAFRRCRVISMRNRCPLANFRNGWRAERRRPPGITDILCPLCRTYSLATLFLFVVSRLFFNNTNQIHAIIVGLDNRYPQRRNVNDIPYARNMSIRGNH
ncbi:cyclic diguanylate phosphodiesterase (EAL) domain protein [Salmonella bongori]|nr:cyclic diguanylate phosphodiesterase (EAL) domain protein [Salmonella bongori]